MAVTRLSDLNRDDIRTTKGSFRANTSLATLKNVRPVGYKFPVGNLTTKEAADFVANPDSMITTTNATKSDSTDHVIYSWTSSGTFEQTGSRNLTSDMLIVAGGGAGHSNDPSGGGMGGGGAGGLLYYSDLPGLTGPPGPASANSKTPNGPTVSIAPTVQYTITVGAGGAAYFPAGEPASPPFPSDVSNLIGTDSSFSNTSPDIPASNQLDLTSTGGGTMWLTSSLKNGGSGGGTYGGAPVPAGTGIAGQGNPGAISSMPDFTGGGGGGAGSEGTTMDDTQPRSGKDGGSAPTTPTHPAKGVLRYASGGDGLDFDISGTRRTYAAGGGGSGRGVAGHGGSDDLGGRGSGSYPGSPGIYPQMPSQAGGNGTVSRGSGGGGGKPGGNGSGGVVIMKISKNSPWLFRT